MKSSLLTGFRALAFALGVSILLFVSGRFAIKSSRDVTLFVLGLVAFWVVIEKVFLNLRKAKAVKPPHP
ncbi:MAG: hypothetical protein K1X51_01220 [Rhodospirillaceae bacterium]|nr:hypothetical protein [Rhodospirillaceae bacterium]